MLQTEKALLALEAQNGLWNGAISRPLSSQGTKAREGEVEAGEQREVGPVCQSLSHSSEVEKEGRRGTTDSTDGCCYQACSLSSKSQIKRPPPPSPALSLSSSLSLSVLQSTPLHSSVVSLTVSVSQSNPVTLLQAHPPPLHTHTHTHSAAYLPLFLPPPLFLHCPLLFYKDVKLLEQVAVAGFDQNGEVGQKLSHSTLAYFLLSGLIHTSFNSPSSPKWCL